jgi:hypothetical protein
VARCEPGKGEGKGTVDDLGGKTLVVLPGTTNEQALKAYIEHDLVHPPGKQPVETGIADADDDGTTTFSCVLVAPGGRRRTP